MRRPQGVRGRRGPPARAGGLRRVDPGLREGAADRRRTTSRSCGRSSRSSWSRAAAHEARARLAPGARDDAAVRPALPACGRSRARRERRARCPGMALEGAVDRVFGRRGARARASRSSRPAARRRCRSRPRRSLADQAMRRGEAKKALSILAPLAEANPGREDVLLRVIQVAEAAGDTTDGDSLAVGPRRRPQVHGPHRGCRDAACARCFSSCRTPPSTAPGSPQLEPAAARHDVDRSGPRAQPTIPVVPPLETSAKRPRPSVEASAQRRVPVEPAAPIPPPPSFAPAPPVAGAAEGEFILEFEDDQLVHEPGSTGPVPNAVRRLSQPVMASFPPVPSAPPVAPPLRAASSRGAARTRAGGGGVVVRAFAGRGSLRLVRGAASRAPRDRSRGRDRAARR